MKAGRLWVGLVLLAMTSAAHAEKYVEIWNPPEARGHAAGSPAQKPVRPHAQKPSAPRLARKVTEPGNAPAVQGASSVVSTKRPGNRSIPRKIGPDGNVFRV
ncbi:hypothetical protein ACFQ3P_27420 [Paraburkholderia sabiae]|uniref:Uncharacterized protein n=1 Tax=Paraburkholderia sabiae TaxID=273251 RepID=A0ABU9QGY0_9BURK|nr:hypothetical protein [Paraburkholderia sabiae]WJZ75893.1 hypothetical protein QEN71_08865 [Paraburkholderia sabiae]CAD6554568.1 hypothetical protein LMG24235_05490 [Paraburkholderia sabiae]CAG9224706.1 conserved exported hypothetical protein [Paraburkholderia sabiae]